MLAVNLTEVLKILSYWFRFFEWCTMEHFYIITKQHVILKEDPTFSELHQIADLWPCGLHIAVRLMRDGWTDSGQWTFGLIDSSAPEGSIICHPPWDPSVQPATAVLPQLWIIGLVRRPQTTLSSPVLLPNAQRGFFTMQKKKSLSYTDTQVCMYSGI